MVAELEGSYWANFSGTGTQYPSDGRGGKTATKGSSHLLAITAELVVIEGILIRANPASDRVIFLADHETAGSNWITSLAIESTGFLTPEYLGLGREGNLISPYSAYPDEDAGGLFVPPVGGSATPGGFGVLPTAAMAFTMFYRVLRRVQG